MEITQTEQPGRPAIKQTVRFQQERRKFLQNVEMANRMQARMEELLQQVQALFHEVDAVWTISRTLRKAIEAQLDAMNDPLIGRRFPGGQKIPDPSPPASDGSRTIPYDELYRFLSALSDLEEENGFISELEYALQRDELERLKRWAVDRKTWPPPDPN